MEDFSEVFYRKGVNEQDIVGVLKIRNEESLQSFTDGFDIVYLVVRECNEKLWDIEHFDCDGEKVSVHTVSAMLLNEWFITGENRRVVDWVLHGGAVFEREKYIATLKARMCEFPLKDRTRKIGIEFSKLVRRFENSKQLFQKEQYLDAFNHVIHALHHLARLSVVERGLFPEVTVWEQVRYIEPETYKLYHELVVGDESLKKRLDLLLIANEFAMSSKTKLGSSHILGVIKANEGGWTFSDLVKQPELSDYVVDLELLLNFLVRKKLLEVEVAESVDKKGIFIYLYKAKVHDEVGRG